MTLSHIHVKYLFDNNTAHNVSIIKIIIDFESMDLLEFIILRYRST